MLSRMARPDILVAVTRLSRYVSRWSTNHDGALIRLFSGIKGTLDHAMSFKIQKGNPLEIRVWFDADSDLEAMDTKSTTGVWIELYSPDPSTPEFVGQLPGCPRAAFTLVSLKWQSVSHARMLGLTPGLFVRRKQQKPSAYT
eukprot:774372-Amphidinium_carterae.1